MEAVLIPAVTSIVGIALLFLGVRALKRKRLVENVPTSKVEGVFLGLTEVKGQAEPRQAIRSYLAEQDVVYYRFSVQEQWRRVRVVTDKEGRVRTKTETGWTTIRSGEVRRPFDLRDDTGALRVDPERAEVHGDCVLDRTVGVWDPLYYQKGPRFAIRDSTYRRRFTEHAIPVGRQLYIMGPAQLREDVIAPELRHDPDAEMYLISTGTEEDVVRRFAWQARLMPALGWLLVAASPVLYFMVGQDMDFSTALLAGLLPIVGLTLLYVGALGLLYLQLVYNGLIDVKNRLAKAWSLIDVQLKRRHDLIPNLVTVVQRLVEHERGVQEGVAGIRTEALAQGLGKGALELPSEARAALVATSIDGQTHALTQIFGVVERYPRLKADTGFLELHEELARTERQIALARTFYNESVTAFNDRQLTMPDVLVAKPAGLRPAPYLQIEAFEKAPVEVRFEADPEEVAPAEPPPDELPEGATAVSEEEIAEAISKGAPAGEEPAAG